TASVSSSLDDPDSSNNSASTSTVVNRSADLAVSKSGPASAKAGNYINYVLTVSNNGPLNGVSETLTDSLSSELQNATYCVDGASACDPAAAGALSWSGPLSTLGAINAGSSKLVRIRAQIAPGSTVDSIDNTASLSAQSPSDPTSSNDTSAMVTTTFSPETDLTLSKSGPASAKAGNYINYVLTVSNNGPSNGASATLTDSLSSELQNAPYCVDGASACNPAAAGALSWSGTLSRLGAINAGASKVVRIRDQIKPGSTASSIDNSASLSAQSPSDPTSSNDTSSTVTTTVSRKADLAVSKSGPASAKAGNYINYVLTVSNNGPSNGVSETLTDSLSSELQNATYCVDGASACDPAAAGALSWSGPLSTLGAINAGSSKLVRIRAQIKPGSTVDSIDNSASLAAQSPSDPTSSNDTSSTVTTTVSREADLAVSKSGPASAKAGNYINYVLTVSNNGPSNGVSETLTDSLSSELQNATYCVDGASACDPAAAGALSWSGPLSTLGAINSGSSKVVRIRAQIKPGSTASS